MKNLKTQLAVLLLSTLFLLQTPALSAQEPAAPKSAATTAVAAEPQAAGQIVSSPSQLVPALPVPRLIKFSGVAKDAAGQRRSGTVGITFSIYAEQQGGATLWMETQNAALDAQGRYAVLLGSTESAGLPLDLFATGEPRWLGAKLELPGEVEQPRVLLVSVPYALKASDADTVGGKPASAFVLAPTGSGAGTGASAPGSTNSTAAKSKAEPLFTSSGTTNYIPIFTDSTGDIGNSNIYQSTAGNVGIGFSNPQQRLVIGAPAGGTVLNATNLSDQDLQVNVTAPGATDKHTYFGPSVATNLTLGVGGVEKVRINSAGNVGIGASNPQQRLVIGAPAGGTVLNATNLSDQDLQVNVTAPGASDKHTYFGPSVATNLTLGVGGAEMMRITNAGRVGIGTSAPAATLDVNGAATVRGQFSLPAQGTATATEGVISHTQWLTASAFNSGTDTAVPQNFKWQAEPVANNTSSPSATLNLLFGSGTSAPTETGFNIASNGLITFAAGQTFPSTGTQILNLSGAAFVCSNQESTGTCSMADFDPSQASMINAEGTWAANVSLPQGAVVTALTLCGHFDETGSSVTATLDMAALTAAVGHATPVAMAGVASSGAANQTQCFQTTTITNATIDNTTNQYYVIVVVPDNSIEFSTVQIAY